jgi:anti-sigma B factor antagonist
LALIQPDLFSVGIGRALGRVILTLHGDLDTAAAPVLRSALDQVIEQQGNLDVIIDLADLDFIDSRGLGVLVAADRTAKERGGTVTLSAPRPRVQRVFEITGLAQHLTLTKT